MLICVEQKDLVECISRTNHAGKEAFLCKSLLTPRYVGKQSESSIRTADFIELCREVLWLFSTRCDGHFHIYIPRQKIV